MPSRSKKAMKKQNQRLSGQPGVKKQSRTQDPARFRKAPLDLEDYSSRLKALEQVISKYEHPLQAEPVLGYLGPRKRAAPRKRDPPAPREAREPSNVRKMWHPKTFVPPSPCIDPDTRDWIQVSESVDVIPRDGAIKLSFSNRPPPSFYEKFSSPDGLAQLRSWKISYRPCSSLDAPLAIVVANQNSMDCDDPSKGVKYSFNSSRAIFWYPPVGVMEAITQDSPPDIYAWILGEGIQSKDVIGRIEVQHRLFTWKSAKSVDHLTPEEDVKIDD